MIFIYKEARTYLNPRVSRVSLFFTSVNTPTLEFSLKSTTVGAHCGAHEIKRPESNGVSIYNQVSSRLQVVSRPSRVFDKFGNLSLQEPKLSKVTGSSTSRLPPAPVQVGLVNEEQLRHGLGSLGETDMNPAEDKADHP
jgi:hypothetical protein